MDHPSGSSRVRSRRSPRRGDALHAYHVIRAHARGAFFGGYGRAAMAEELRGDVCTCDLCCAAEGVLRRRGLPIV